MRCVTRVPVSDRRGREQQSSAWSRRGRARVARSCRRPDQPLGSVASSAAGSGASVVSSADDSAPSWPAVSPAVSLAVALRRYVVRDRLRLLGQHHAGDRAGEGREHLAHVGELGVDAVAALGGGAELAVGLCAHPVGRRAGVGHHRGGALLGVGEHPGDAGLGLAPGAFHRGLRVAVAGGHRVELGLRGRLLGLELRRRLLAALGQRRLEVGRGLRRLGPGVLVERLGLGAAGGRVALGGVALGLGRGPRVGDEPATLGLGVAAGLVGVAVRLSAHGPGLRLGVLLQRLDLADHAVADLGRLGLGEGQDLADPLAEVGVRRSLGLLRLP